MNRRVLVVTADDELWSEIARQIGVAGLAPERSPDPESAAVLVSKAPFCMIVADIRNTSASPIATIRAAIVNIEGAPPSIISVDGKDSMLDNDRLKQVFEAGADLGVCAPLSEETISEVIASEAIRQDIYRDLATVETRLTRKIRELSTLSDRYREENESLSKALRGIDRKYDVAISFAAPERPLAEELATMLRRVGLAVFYDEFYADVLWGKDLVVYFDEVFRRDSRFCVVFVSSEYLNRMWTTHERRSAQARALAERKYEYLLPIQVDDSELPGMPPTVGYLSLKKYSIAEIGAILLRKILGGIPADAVTAKLLDLIHRGVVTIRSLASASPFPYVRCPACSSESLDADAYVTDDDTIGFVRCSTCKWIVTDRDRPLWED